jgi:hypothetical protein
VRVAAPEDVIILKAMANRPQDRADISAIVAAQGNALDRALIRRELADLGFDEPDELG